VQFLSINDSVQIHCHFKNDDKQLAGDIKIEWFDGPLPLKTVTNGITIKDSKTDTMIKSTLVFKKIQDLHFGRYTCKATSIKGTIKTATTSLLTKSMYCASIWLNKGHIYALKKISCKGYPMVVMVIGPMRKGRL